jgi:hypothetical protein
MVSRKEVMELAYEFADQTKNYPKSWDMNRHAGEQWFTDFMKCNNKVVSLQKPQTASLVWATALNTSVVELLFQKYRVYS